ncbi:MAG: type II and III secretion system protein family protein [Deltaproteobacteria bacterium]|nr:type II and III secretion system protein family protein [Deltaproteobacteria bacterium]
MPMISKRALILLPLVVAPLLVWGGAPTPARAERRHMIISVPVRGARVVRFRHPIDNVTVANPKIADVKPMGTRALQIIGRRIGETEINVSDKRGTTTVVDVAVGLATGGLSSSLRSVFPGEAIIPQSIGDKVALTGRVSDPIIAKRAVQLAAAYLKAEKGSGSVLNFLSIRGRQQVQLRVKIAEVSRTAMRRLGINAFQRGTLYSAGMLAPGTPMAAELAPDVAKSLYPNGDIAAPDGDNKVPLPHIVGPITSSFGLHFASGGALPLSIALNIMQGKGLAKILSEPTLVAYSGQQANFLAGGEFPIPIPQGLGQTAVEFKKYGVQLEFTPTVLANKTVHMKVSVTVSERDDASSLVLQGTRVPALTTRHSQTTVRIKNGQSLAIAGLLQDRITSVSNRVPILGDIPVLGMFFRSSTFDRQERELVIMVTPHLVRPLRPKEVPPLPGEDEVSDPGAVAFFLLGSVDPEIKADKPSRAAGPVGYSE